MGWMLALVADEVEPETTDYPCGSLLFQVSLSHSLSLSLSLSLSRRLIGFPQGPYAYIKYLKWNLSHAH